MNVLNGTFRLTGLSPYSPSAPVPDDLLVRARNETADQLEKRIWRERIWANEAGEVFHPASYYKKAVDAAASLTKRKVRGAGNQTFAQQIVSGIMILDDIPIFKPQTPAEIKNGAPTVPILKSEVIGQQIYCDPGGDRRGVGKRVFRTYGIVKQWEAILRIWVVNATITQDIVETYLQEAGMLIGVGRWRPAVGGANGRFLVSSCEWSDRPLTPAG